MVRRLSPCPLISKSSSPCTNPSRIVPNATNYYYYYHLKPHSSVKIVYNRWEYLINRISDVEQQCLEPFNSVPINDFFFKINLPTNYNHIYIYIYIYLNYHDKKIRQTPICDVRNTELLFRPYWVYISRAYCDLHHWRSNQQPQNAKAEILPLGHRFISRIYIKHIYV